MTRLQTAFLWAALGVGGASVVFLAAIFRSTSSTAAIGILFIPFVAAPFAVPFFIFGYCLPDLAIWGKGRSATLSVWMRLRAVIAILLLICGSGYFIYGVILTSKVKRVRVVSESELSAFLDSSMFRNDKFALGALAQNANASAAILDKVARMPAPELHEKMGSIWPVMEGNGKGLAVMRLIAMHKNVSETTLIYLSRSPNEYVRSSVASNPKTPVPIIRELSQKSDYLAQWGLAANPNTPADILNKLAGSGDGYARSSVARNSGTPVETLVRLAKDPVWHVRRDIVSNPRAPIETIESLGSDPDERVRSLVEYTLNRRKAHSSVRGIQEQQRIKSGVMNEIIQKKAFSPPTEGQEQQHPSEGQGTR